MAVGKGAGYIENENHRPAFADIDGSSMDSDHPDAMVDPSPPQHPAHVKGTLDTTGVGVEDNPDPTALLAPVNDAADIPPLGYVSGETHEPAAAGEELAPETVQAIADEAAAEIQALSGVEEEVKVTIDETPVGDDLDSLGVDDLKERARAAEVKGFSSMNKPELLKAVRKAEKDQG